MAHATDTTTAAPALMRFSWGAIFAGVAVAVVVHLVLSILGMAIGVGTIDPLQETNPVEGIGLGSAIYMIVVAIIALFCRWFYCRVPGTGSGSTRSHTTWPHYLGYRHHHDLRAADHGGRSSHWWHRKHRGNRPGSNWTGSYCGNAARRRGVA